MIWINYFVLILFEAWGHSRLINKGIDPTPKDWTVLKGFVILFRGLLFWAVWILNELHEGFGLRSLEFMCFALGALFLHLLVFPLALNRLRKPKKSWDYFGNDGVDWLIRKVTYDFFPARLFWLLVLASGFIYGFYHTDLL